jgi:hypothetical protein
MRKFGRPRPSDLCPGTCIQFSGCSVAEFAPAFGQADCPGDVAGTARDLTRGQMQTKCPLPIPIGWAQYMGGDDEREMGPKTTVGLAIVDCYEISNA